MKTNLPPLRSLQAFEVFGRLGSVGGAARELGVTAGAISQQIKVLEDHLGLAVIARDGRRAALAPGMSHYHEIVRAGFDKLRLAQDLIRQRDSDVDVKLSGLPTLLLKWLNPRIHRFQAKVGEVALRLDASHAEPDPMLLDHMFRLTYGRAAAAFDHHRTLFTDRCFPVCSPDFLARYPEAATVAGMAGLPWIDIDWGPAYRGVPHLDDWIAAQGHGPSSQKPVAVHSLSSLALEGAAAGRGVALAQSSFAAFDLAAGRLVRLSDHAIDMPEPYFVCWGAATLKRPNARDFLNWLLTEARAQQEIG